MDKIFCLRQKQFVQDNLGFVLDKNYFVHAEVSNFHVFYNSQTEIKLVSDRYDFMRVQKLFCYCSLRAFESREVELANAGVTAMQSSLLHEMSLCPAGKWRLFSPYKFVKAVYVKAVP